MAKDHSFRVPQALTRGRYVARFARGDADLRAAQSLRHRCFVEDAGRGAFPDRLESDAFDALCDHVLVCSDAGDVVCCFRVMALAGGAQIHTSYSAQYYDLERLSGYDAPMVELGRFCVARSVVDPDVLRIAWGMLAAYVDAQGAGLLFGCASFNGTQTAPYDDALDLMAARHLAPEPFQVGVKAREVVRFAATARAVTDRKRALGQMPSLLRTYLGMGGFVSDHAVIDRAMNTLHVFTALEIANIPPARAAALRAISPLASEGAQR